MKYFHNISRAQSGIINLVFLALTVLGACALGAIHKTQEAEALGSKVFVIEADGAQGTMVTVKVTGLPSPTVEFIDPIATGPQAIPLTSGLPINSSTFGENGCFYQVAPKFPSTWNDVEEADDVTMKFVCP